MERREREREKKMAPVDPASLLSSTAMRCSSRGIEVLQEKGSFALILVYTVERVPHHAWEFKVKNWN